MAEWCRGVADSSIQPVAFSLQLLLVPGRLCRRPPHPHPTLSSDPLPSFPHQHCLCSVPIPGAPPPGQLPVSPDLLVLSAEDSPCKLTRHHSKPVAPTAPRGKLTASPKSQCGGTTSRTHVADQQMKRRPWMGDDTWAAAAATRDPNLSCQQPVFGTVLWCVALVRSTRHHQVGRSRLLCACRPSSSSSLHCSCWRSPCRARG